MRKLCPNFESEPRLDTILEIPIPDEMFGGKESNASTRWKNMRIWLKTQSTNTSTTRLLSNSEDEFTSLLKLIGSPLIPVQAHFRWPITRPINGPAIEASIAKYIVQQYTAATGGQGAWEGVTSMYAIGEVNMLASDLRPSGESMSVNKSTSEVGGFVLWQKNPDLWYFELIVSGYKLSAGSDGTLSWSQSATQPSTKGPPRPLRRFIQGLDPRLISNLFFDSLCTGEKAIDGQDCFTLKVEATPPSLKSQSTSNTEVIHHTMWGYFSQRTGLLVQLEDSKLVRMRTGRGEGVFWETSMETSVRDYKHVESVNVAHGGKTVSTLYRYGAANGTKKRIEETWRIEEVDFNVSGLTMDCFLPPRDLTRDFDSG